MPKLISREKQIPQGFIFYIPALNWRSTQWASFDSVVRSAIGVLQANPHVASKLGWDLSYDAMCNRIDEFNAVVCEKMNWNAYITGGAPGGGAPPNPFPSQSFPARPGGGNVAARKMFAPPPQVVRTSGALAAGVAMVKKLAKGAATLMEWQEAGMPHAEQALAEKRAATCATCPKNVQGKNLTDYFTVPLAEMIKKKMEVMAQLDLKTPSDDKLFVCEACYCPLRTKVFFPLELVIKRLKPEDKAELNRENPKCWILTELNEAP